MQTLDTYWFHESTWESYDQLYDEFEWDVPDQFNVADYVCDRWAEDEGRVAVYAEDAEGNTQTYTFEELRTDTNRLANYLTAQGIERGDRVGLNLPQKVETVIAHIACWKLGALSVPLSTLFGQDGLEYRLDNAGAKVCIVDDANVDALRTAASGVESLETIVTVDCDQPEQDETDFWDVLEGRSTEFETTETAADDDLVLIYTSGTTGNPKGVRHGHRMLLGHLPCFITTFCNLDVGNDAVFWSPAEWAWVLIFDIVFPPLFYGQPILAYFDDGPFDPQKAYELIDRYDVTHYFAPPTALRMMREADAGGFTVGDVDVVTSGGEPLGENLVKWIYEEFDGAALNEAYGQTEANLLVGSCEALMETPPGKIGRAIPGHDVRLADPDDPTETTSPGEIGEFAVRYEGDPVCFKEYWNRPEATAEKIQAGYVLTEDLGIQDEDGFFGFHSRKDDVILTAGYRIGPSEIEDSLSGHPAVSNAGVIGVPDEERGEVPNAFIVLSPGYESSPELEKELQDYVKDNLAKYEYPRELEFIDELPKTVTGKVRRADLENREDTR